MSDELKPCPFCGGEPLDLGDGYYCCDNDDCAGVSLDCTKDQWNARHTPEGFALVPVGAINEAIGILTGDAGPISREQCADMLQDSMITAAQEDSE